MLIVALPFIIHLLIYSGVSFEIDLFLRNLMLFQLEWPSIKSLMVFIFLVILVIHGITKMIVIHTDPVFCNLLALHTILWLSRAR